MTAPEQAAPSVVHAHRRRGARRRMAPVRGGHADMFHQTSGAGTVTHVEGDKLDVQFDRAGLKKGMARFVTRGEGDDAIPF
jgi:hypothetical protein